MVRKMADRQFAAAARAGIDDGPVAPVNALARRWSDPDGRGWIPPVAPTYGGVDARVLLLLRDPGPMTHTDGGSGLLSAENDDPSAQRLCELLDRHGIAQTDCVAWNAYPWYSHGETLRTGDFAAGQAPLVELLDLCRRLEVVVLLGGDAQKWWARLARDRHGVASRYATVATFHTPNRAFAGVSREVRAERLDRIDADFAAVAALLAERDGERSP